MWLLFAIAPTSLTGKVVGKNAPETKSPQNEPQSEILTDAGWKVDERKTTVFMDNGAATVGSSCGGHAP